MTTLSGMKYVWSMSGSYGEFVSGENSNTVTIKGIELSYGELKLQVKYYGSSTSKTVEVNIYPKLGSILIQPQNIYTSRNTNTDLTLYLYDENNYQVSITPDVQITWKVIGGIGTIQPLHGGSMAIFASTFIGTGWVEAEVNYYGDVFTNRTRIIVPQTLDYIKAEPSTAIVYCDDEFQFSVSAFDTNDNLISGKIDYQWDLLYDLGEIIDTSEDNTKIFRPITPGETVIVVNADYYGSSATLQIRITVPPKLNKLSLKPGRAIIPLNNGQTFEVRAYDSDDIIVMDNITYSWAFANVTGNLQELDEQYKVKFIGQSLGFGQIIVEAIHYTKMLKLRTNITIVQRLSKILIDHANTEVFTGESYILTAIPYDDADEMIAGNVDFNWITSTGELVPFDDHNSSVEFLSKSTGNIKITVTGHYYGIDIEETIELQVKEKKTGGDRFGGVVLFVIIGVIGIIIIFLIIFMVLKRKHHPNLRKKTDTGIGMNGSTLDYRVPLTTTDVRTYPGPETTTLNAQPIQQVQYLQPIQSMVPNQYLQPIQPQPSELFPTLNEIQQSQIQPQSKQQETRDNDSSSQLLQYTPPKHSDQSHGSSSQE
jgi:hypothetical protein